MGGRMAAYRSTVGGQLQRVVDIGPDSVVGKVRSQLRARRASLRRDDGTGIVSEDWFADIYAGTADPWDYMTSDYERRKYSLLLAALPNERYRRAYEPGCSIGILSTGLAERCDELRCSDFLPQAVDLARARLLGLEGVSVERHTLPEDFPEDEVFDLVVLGDVCMFLTPKRLDDLTRRIVASLVPGGHVVALHGHHLSADIFQSGDQAHARIRRHPALRKLGGYRDQSFRLDIWERRPGQGAPTMEGRTGLALIEAGAERSPSERLRGVS